MASLQTCWKGEPLGMGTVYCVVVDWDEEPVAVTGPGAGSATLADRVVQAVQNRFSQQPTQAAAAQSAESLQRPRTTSESLQRMRLRG